MMKLFELDLDLGPTCRIHLARAKLAAAPPPCAFEGSGRGVATAAGGRTEHESSPEVPCALTL